MAVAHGGSCASQHADSDCQVNVGADERLISKVVGGGLLLLGLDQRSFSGLMLAALGGAMLYRGITGNCHVYRALDIDTSEHDGLQRMNRLEPEEAAIGGAG